MKSTDQGSQHPCSSTVPSSGPPPGRPSSTLAVGLGLVLVVACSATEQPRAERELPFELVEGEPMYQLLPPDGIPSIDAPTFVSAEEGDGFLKPEEMVLGVVGQDGTAKCYSAWQLDGHEIVNDVLDGDPIAATW